MDERMVTRVLNKGPRRLALAAVLAILSTGMTACAERAEVTLHEPGVYKGGADPLLAKQRDPQQVEALQERFAKGQSDR